MTAGYEMDNLLNRKLNNFKLVRCRHLNDVYFDEVNYDILDTIDEALAADKHGFNRDDIYYDYAEALVHNIYNNIEETYSEDTVQCVVLDVYILLWAGCIFSDKSVADDNVINTDMITNYFGFVQHERERMDKFLKR